MTSLSAVSRRDALCIAAAALALAPALARADAAAVEAELKKLYGERKPGTGKIRIEVPAIAENGLVVPISIEVDSPMTEQDHVKAVHVFADGNPLPGVVSFRFTPACGKAAAATRMRLAKTQNVVAIAEMADGSLFSTKTEVTVTVGGCVS